MTRILKKGWFFILSGALLVLFLIVTRDDKLPEQSPNLSVVSADNMQADKEASGPEAQSSIAVVDVKGEVAEPGVYEMNIDARVDDVIGLAGGFTEKADQTYVNLAEKVQDEMVIHVPGEDKAGESGPQPAAENGKVRVNQAIQEDLETLSGIGPSKAEAIISYREEHGFFQTPEDLLQVSGIGEKTLEAIYDELQIP